MVLGLVITLWSPIGRDLINFSMPAPFGMRDDAFQMILSLPVVLYSARLFVAGAARALRARTLDTMVLVATGAGAGWVYSVGVTLTGGGDVFYEATTFVTAWVLLSQYLKMRALAGANDSARVLLDLVPPAAVVLRGGEPVEIRTDHVVVGDLLLIRPGFRIASDGIVEGGQSYVDESAVTGEGLPVHRGSGDAVLGATINTTGTMRVRATRVGADTALAQIVKLTQEAEASRAPGHRLAVRTAFWLAFVVLAGGVGALAVWMLAGRPIAEGLVLAITMVVLTCSDTPGSAIPHAIGAGTGAGRGVASGNATDMAASKEIDGINALTLTWLELPYAMPDDPGMATLREPPGGPTRGSVDEPAGVPEMPDRP